MNYEGLLMLLLFMIFVNKKDLTLLAFPVLTRKSSFKILLELVLMEMGMDQNYGDGRGF